MEEKRKKLLEKLSLSEAPINAVSCAKELNVSVRKVKQEIKEINTELEKHGAVITGKTGKGNGYTLCISDDTSFQKYLNEDLPKKIVEENSYLINQNARVSYLIRRLLEAEEYVKYDDLAEELALSSSQLNRDIQEVKKYIKTFKLSLVSRSHYGVKVQGSELGIRLALANLINTGGNGSLSSDSQDSLSDNEQIGKIRNIIIRKCNEMRYTLSDITCQNLVTHLFVALKRTKEKYRIEFDEAEAANIRRASEYKLAQMIVNEIEREFSISLPETEVVYCTIHLRAKKILDGNYVFDQSIVSCLNDMLENIYQKFGFDFRNNLSIRTTLGLHLVPLVSRINYHLDLKNPLLSDIKAKYIVAYDLGVCCAEVINRYYQCELSEDETSYIAVHFILAIQENQESMKKKRVLLICSSGRGTAQLLKAEFLQQFRDLVDNVQTTDIMSLKKLRLSEYDYIFTTVPIQEDIGKPVIMISSFMNGNDNRKISNTLLQKDDSFMKKFDRDLFITHLQVKDKEEVIRLAAEKIIDKHGLDKAFTESVLEREDLAKTNFGYSTALPHATRAFTEETIFCVVILEKPIQWYENETVQVVMLGAFGRKFARNNEEFFTKLSNIVTSKRLINKLIRKQDFETFTEIVNEAV